MSLYEHIKPILFSYMFLLFMLFGASDFCCCYLVQIITGNKKAYYKAGLCSLLCVLVLTIVFKVMFVIGAIPIQCNDKKGR